MTVTEIAKLSDARSKVYIDEKFAFVLYKGELRMYKIAEGKEIAEDIYHHIISEVLPKRAKLRCMNLLQKRNYTRHQLEEKLEQGGYPSICVESALSYVESYGYIDDEKYADDYILYKLKTKSLKQIEMELKVKGIERETIQCALQKIQQTEYIRCEEELIKKLMKKRHYEVENSTWEERQKLLAFLYRKGFDASAIENTLTNMRENKYKK